LCDLRSRVLLIFLNIVAPPFDVSLVLVVFNNHLLGLNQALAATRILLQHLYVFSQLLKVSRVHNFLQLFFGELKLVWVFFVFVLQIRKQHLLLTFIKLVKIYEHLVVGVTVLVPPFFI
jgi:hypothetical protein